MCLTAACVESQVFLCTSVDLQDLSGVAAAVDVLQAALREYVQDLGPVEVKLWAKQDLPDDDIMRCAKLLHQHMTLPVTLPAHLLQHCLGCDSSCVLITCLTHRPL